MKNQIIPTSQLRDHNWRIWGESPISRLQIRTSSDAIRGDLTTGDYSHYSPHLKVPPSDFSTDLNGEINTRENSGDIGGALANFSGKEQSQERHLDKVNPSQQHISTGMIPINSNLKISDKQVECGIDNNKMHSSLDNQD